MVTMVLCLALGGLSVILLRKVKGDGLFGDVLMDIEVISNGGLRVGTLVWCTMVQMGLEGEWDDRLRKLG